MHNEFKLLYAKKTPSVNRIASLLLARVATSLKREAKIKPVYGYQVMFAWLAGQYTAHLCAFGNIRAMPETEIPPVIRGIFICRIGVFFNPLLEICFCTWGIPQNACPLILAGGAPPCRICIFCIRGSFCREIYFFLI